MSATTVDIIDASSTSAFQIGDVVTLHEGGPRMTVAWCGADVGAFDERLICQWFDVEGELRQNSFGAAQVRLVPRSIPPGSVR